jgi:hypothetical protein
MPETPRPAHFGLADDLFDHLGDKQVIYDEEEELNDGLAFYAKPQPKEEEKKPLDLTLGVEIECILAMNYHPNAKPKIDSCFDRDSIDHVLNALITPLTARCSTCGKKHRFTIPLADNPYGMLRGAASSKYFSSWAVDSDSSVYVDFRDARLMEGGVGFVKFAAIEIKSRVLSRTKPLQTTKSQSQPGHIHSVSYEEEIRAVLNKLHTTFNAHNGKESGTSSPFRLFVNQSCGFHVHIGNQGVGFPMETVRNIVSTCVVNERPLDSLHAADRIGGTTQAMQPQHGNLAAQAYAVQMQPQSYNFGFFSHHAQRVYQRRTKACQELSFSPPEDFNWGSEYPETMYDNPEIKAAAFEYSTTACVTLIQNAPDMDALHKMQGPAGHHSTVNLDNLGEYRYEKDPFMPKITIEFRQHAGTLQTVEVLAWVDVVASIVEYGHATTASQIVARCTGEWQSPTHHVVDLMRTIGCSNQTIQHYEHRLNLGSSGKSYAEDFARQQSKEWKKMLSPDDQILPLLRHYSQQTLQVNHPDAVGMRISKKMLEGAYGQFPDNFLEQLTFPSELADVKENLRIGWEHPNSLSRTPSLDSLAAAEAAVPDSTPTFSRGASHLGDAYTQPLLEPDCQTGAEEADEDQWPLSATTANTWRIAVDMEEGRVEDFSDVRGWSLNRTPAHRRDDRRPAPLEGLSSPLVINF